MKTLRLYVLILFGLLTLNHSAYSQVSTFSKTLQVSKGGTISVDISAGNVYVQTWKKDVCTIVIEEVNKEDLENISLTQDGNEISLKTTGEIRYMSDVKISIPESFNADINTRGGNIGISGYLDGNLSIKTSGGNIKTGNVAGNATVKTAGGNVTVGNIEKELTIKTSGGNITTGNLGGSASVSTAGGNIEIGSAKDNLNVSTSGGNIEIKEGLASVTASTAGGNIGVEKLSGASKLSTSGGDIDVKSAGGDLTLKTAAGSIEVLNVSGSLKASTSAGDIKCHVKQGFKGEVSLDTKVGSVYLMLPSGINATVEANVRGIVAWGDPDAQNFILSDFNPTRGPEFKGKKEVSATFEINGGGNKISLKANMGSINIRRAK